MDSNHSLFIWDFPFAAHISPVPEKKQLSAVVLKKLSPVPVTAVFFYAVFQKKDPGHPAAASPVTGAGQNLFPGH